MRSDEKVLNALRALAEHDRQEEAAPIVEARVLRGFRQARKQRMLRRVGVWSAAVAAAAVAVLFVSAPRPRVEPTKKVVQVATQPFEVQPLEVQPLEVVPQESAPIVVAAPNRVSKSSKQIRREIVTQFFMLTDSRLPLDRGQLVRVRVPASVMYSVGLPVNPDRWTERVDADVVVGEEGMARAIRFVGYEQ